jgi:hypothetical protein
MIGIAAGSMFSRDGSNFESNKERPSCVEDLPGKQGSGSSSPQWPSSKPGLVQLLLPDCFSEAPSGLYVAPVPGSSVFSFSSSVNVLSNISFSLEVPERMNSRPHGCRRQLPFLAVPFFRTTWMIGPTAVDSALSGQLILDTKRQSEDNTLLLIKLCPKNR